MDSGMILKPVSRPAPWLIQGILEQGFELLDTPIPYAMRSMEAGGGRGSGARPRL